MEIVSAQIHYMNFRECHDKHRGSAYERMNTKLKFPYQVRHWKWFFSATPRIYKHCNKTIEKKTFFICNMYMIKQQIKCAPLCISRPQGHIFILKLIGRQLYVKLELNHEPISCHVIFCIKIFISSPPTPCPNLIIPLSQTQTQTTQFSHEKTCKLIWKNCANRILNITIPKIEFAHLFDLFNF